MGRLLYRSLLAGLLFSCTATAWSQASGFNLNIFYGHGLLKGEKAIDWGGAGGSLGYHHDLSSRFGLALNVGIAGDNLGASSVEGIYGAKYFFSDNDETAVYIGSFIGVQSLKASVSEYVSTNPNGAFNYRTIEASKLQVPVGLQLGLRGGLDGFFGELFIQAGYAIGSGDFYSISPNETVKTSPLYFSLGLGLLGFGWDH